MSLAVQFHESSDLFDIGVDEAGRGPLLGRVYSAAVILPKENFKHELMKDSKLIKSEKKMNEIAKYIMENAKAWQVAYCTEEEIDTLNILQATQKCMKMCIEEVLISPKIKENVILLIDGNYFKHDNLILKYKNLKEIHCIKGGDNSYTCIAAASILAKCARDNYIKHLCQEYPELDEKYNISKNKGYGAKKHMDGIKEFGITRWHRKSFKPCKK
jgi:ribonuclease HII